MINRKFVTSAMGCVRLDDPVLAPREKTCRDMTIPSSLQKCYDTGRIEALKLQWKEGQPNKPHIYWDSDVAKVLEGMAFELGLHPEDRKMAEDLEKVVALFEAAQCPDGYLNSYFTGVEPEKRWNCLAVNHELYCAGHLMEAAVAHFYATGSRRFLDVMCRYADYIATVFGREEGKKRGYPGHEEIELGLCRLADATGNDRYLKLAEYFINERGQSPNYFSEEAVRNGNAPMDEYLRVYFQADKPVREQLDADGHAVRALYLYTGMADVAARTGDRTLLDAAIRLFDSISQRRMYITGGVGSSRDHERFTVDYELRNALAYAESCAAMALVQFARRLFEATGESRYVDVMEQALYNGVLSGISLKGDTFFYANPLEVDENFYEEGFVFKSRKPWFDCSCCPTSFCRFLPQMASFTWATGKDGSLCLNIPAAGVYQDATRRMTVSGRYPYDGAIRIVSGCSGRFALRIRIPGWCRQWSAAVNGNTVAPELENGYCVIDRDWADGDSVELNLDMPVDTVHAHSMVSMDAGRFALMRGPVVYALEGVDNGSVLPRISIPEEQTFRLEAAEGLPEGTVAISGQAWEDVEENGELYIRKPNRQRRSRTFTAIPYALWNNRGDSTMAVWLRGC